MNISREQFKKELENLISETEEKKESLTWDLQTVKTKNFSDYVKKLIYILFLKNINSQTTQHRRSFNYLREYVGELEYVGWVVFKEE